MNRELFCHAQISFCFVSKNENLTRFKKQQSAEHTAERDKVERIVGNTERQRVFFFHWCKLGLQGCVHNLEELFSASFAEDPAWLDKPLGTAGGERHWELCAFCSREKCSGCRCWTMHYRCIAYAKDCIGNVSDGERSAGKGARR